MKEQGQLTGAASMALETDCRFRHCSLRYRLEVSAQEREVSSKQMAAEGLWASLLPSSSSFLPLRLFWTFYRCDKAL